MISCLVLASSGANPTPLETDLQSAGIHVLGAVQRSMLVQESVRLGPDVVVGHEASADDALLDAIALMQATVARPVLLFTADPDVDRMRRAIDEGVHGYVVNGYSAQRLRSLIHLTIARFAREQKLRAELADVSHRFEERKLVDRAKGILMRARQVSEEEAFRVLRAASMHTNQRVGQVSQHVITAAALAEGVNRAGRLRMLSQRLLKLYVLSALGAPSAVDESVAKVDASLDVLSKSLSKATYGDLLDAVQASWGPLKAILQAPVDAARLAQADDLAERVALHADRLVSALQASGANTLHVINLAGRQRMLSQRFANQSLLAAMLRGDGRARASEEAARARREFDEALGYLDAAPLSTREIRDALDDAKRTWGDLAKAAARLPAKDGIEAVAAASESLLALFDDLAERYERSMQVLIG